MQTIAPSLLFISSLTTQQQRAMTFSILVIAVFEPLGLLGLWLRIKGQV